MSLLIAGTQAQTLLPLGLPSLAMVRTLQRAQPPTTGAGDAAEAGDALEAGIHKALSLLESVKVTKTCQVKVVVLAATTDAATALPDPVRLGDQVASRGTAEVM